MKVNLSIDGEYFKNKVKDLRTKLEKCKETGILDDDFEDKLDKLLQIEKNLLIDLIPYYRTYVDDVKKTSMKVFPMKELGSFTSHGLPQSILRINKNLFITNSINSKIQFFYTDIPKNLSEEKEIVVEWSPPIKEIKEKISFIYKLNHKEILLLGAKRGYSIILSDDFDKLPDINEEIKVKRIQIDSDFKGFGITLEIGDTLFITENKKNTLTLFEIMKENGEYFLNVHTNISCIIPNWTAMEKIGKNYFVVGTKDGIIYFIKYEDGQLRILGETYIFHNIIRKINCLEDEKGNKKSIIVIGNKGQCKIFDLYEDTILESYDLKGNLFDLQSVKGTSVVLSEDGIIYLFEENFGSWHLNEEATIKDIFFTNIFKLNISKYLLIDIEGELNLLYIDRIHTPQDLWNMALYQ
ncbi:MAG TPA: hypothetical protein VK071_11875 [Tissierellales bacterium]|nr:hypothetical protein [Tissierellales bacterium]